MFFFFKQVMSFLNFLWSLDHLLKMKKNVVLQNQYLTQIHQMNNFILIYQEDIQ